MTLHVKPELGVEITKSGSFVDLKDRAEAACNTAEQLVEHGLDVAPTKEDQENAAKLVAAYAEATLTPASLMLTDKILKEFGQSVVESSIQIRHLVTNKLLLESENPDPRVRMRALELLGKISDVGLFSEKSEITITHQSTDDLREKLRGKLERLVAGEVIEDAVFVDVKEELGISEAEPEEVKQEEEQPEEEYDD